MGWNSDLGVLEYLEKRLRYYKRKATWCSNLIVPEVKSNMIKMMVSQKWRKSFTIKQIREATKHYEKRVKEYQDAIEKLKH